MSKSTMYTKMLFLYQNLCAALDEDVCGPLASTYRKYLFFSDRPGLTY